MLGSAMVSAIGAKLLHRLVLWLQVGGICQYVNMSLSYVIVIELHKICLFVYIPWTKSGILTLFSYTLTGLFSI
jgi:hypothetical protein